MRIPTPTSLPAKPSRPARGVASLLAGATILGAPLHAVTWTGSVPTDWNLDAIRGGTAAVNTFARIDIASPVATISSNFAGTPNFIMIGNGAGINGRPDHPSGYEYRSFSLSSSDGLPSKGFRRSRSLP